LPLRLALLFDNLPGLICRAAVNEQSEGDTVKRIVHAAVLLTAVGWLVPASAALTYPISGRWAAERGEQNPDCQKPPYMEFQGDRRFDFGNSSVPEYRALSIVRLDGAAFKITELVFTGQVDGRLYYTLQVRDADHATMRLQGSGRRIDLKRCP
jgi:hypothetical protein